MKPKNATRNPVAFLFFRMFLGARKRNPIGIFFFLILFLYI